MKAFVINSPLFRERNNLYDEDSLPPLGLGYIATTLENNGIEVELIDTIFKKLSVLEIVAFVSQNKPEFVAINIFTTNYDLVKDIIESIAFKTHIIIGGLSTKQLYTEIIKWNTPNQIDIITGDGELIILDIVLNKVSDTPFYRTHNRRVFFIEESSNYFVKDISNIPLNRKFFLNEPIKHALGFTEANIIASRGCIFNCTFCAAARSLNIDYPVRERSEDSICLELREIQSKYPEVNSIRVLDDLFLKNEISVKKSINIFSQFDFQWRSMAHVLTFNKINEEQMTLLKGSGCFELFIGIESGSPKILSAINKTKNINQIITNLTKVFKAGINIKGYFIYGFPDETEEDMEQTYSLAQKLKSIAMQQKVNFRTSVFQYRPYHGTQIYHDLDAKGINLNVSNTKPNQTLSNLVGRLQFNFHSGNYSLVEYEKLHDYIYRTTNLNDGKIFAGLQPKT